MEAIVRSLQTRTNEDIAPLAVVLDNVHCIGGGPILVKIVEKLLSTTTTAVAVAALGQPPAAYQHLPSLRLVDCWTGPHGWKKDPETTLPLFHGTNGLALLQSRLLGEDSINSPPTIIILDSLSPLIDAFTAPAVATTLTALRRHAAGVLVAIHADLHPRAEVDALCYGAASVTHLGPAPERLPPAPQIHGRLSVRIKRKSGMIKAENIEYRVENDGEITVFKPFEAITAVPPPPPPPDSAASSLATMRLEVTEEEAAARERVQLPYEHQGQGQLYAAGVDFREYLPEAAGGRARGQGRLGHILYVRDSDSEDPDSDEDPDDDLDV